MASGFRTIALTVSLSTSVLLAACARSSVEPSPVTAEARADAPRTASGGVSNESSLVGPITGTNPRHNGQIEVCKRGNDSGHFTESVISGAAAIAAAGHTIPQQTCEIVAETSNGLTGATVSVTESPSTNLVWVSAVNNTTSSPASFSNGGSFFVNSQSRYSIFFYNAVPGWKACGPGYWKQERHFDSWPSPYTPSTLVRNVFNVSADDLSLLDALQLKGNTKSNGIAHQAVAALLNAQKGFGYPLPTSVVVGRVNGTETGIFADSDTTGLLETLNEGGSCPLN